MHMIATILSWLAYTHIRSEHFQLTCGLHESLLNYYNDHLLILNCNWRWWVFYQCEIFAVYINLNIWSQTLRFDLMTSRINEFERINHSYIPGIAIAIVQSVFVFMKNMQYRLFEYNNSIQVTNSYYIYIFEIHLFLYY